jgi:protein O-GlcNAc transferase
MDAIRGLDADPNNVTAWQDPGNALSGLKRYQKAIASYDKALALELDNRNIWTNRGAAPAAIKRKDQPDVEEGMPSNPRDANAWSVRLGGLSHLCRVAEAVEARDWALSLDPDYPADTRIGTHSRLFACNWWRQEADTNRIAAGVKTGLPVVNPLGHRAVCDSEQEHLAVTRLWPNRLLERLLWRGERYCHDEIRIAYVSTDLRSHVVGSVMVGCFEHHDKTRFETTAISLGLDDKSNTRRRIEAAFAASWTRRARGL